MRAFDCILDLLNKKFSFTIVVISVQPAGCMQTTLMSHSGK